MNNNWLDTIRTFAPTVAAAFGGPMAGIATKMLSETLLGHGSGTKKNLADAILGATSEDFVKLKTLETKFEAEMKRLDVDVFKLEVDDRKDARANNKGDKTPAVLGLVCFAGFFGILCSLIFVEIPEASRPALTVMLGSLGTIVAQVANYYWGSSKSSSEKNDIIKGLMR